MIPKKLFDGYQIFLKKHFFENRKRYSSLSRSGQKPEIMLFSCCDSRISPELIFDTKPGEMFIVRNIASLIPPYQNNSKFPGSYTIDAAIEFALSILKIKHIIVLGHSKCGGIRFILRKDNSFKKFDSISKWISQIQFLCKNFDINVDEKIRIKNLELEAIKYSLKNLLTFPLITRCVTQNKLELHGVHFTISTGELLMFSSKEDNFFPLRSSKQ